MNCFTSARTESNQGMEGKYGCLRTAQDDLTVPLATPELKGYDGLRDVSHIEEDFRVCAHELRKLRFVFPL